MPSLSYGKLDAPSLKNFIWLGTTVRLNQPRRDDSQALAGSSG